MFFAVQNLFYLEYQATGLTFGTVNLEYQNYQFSTALIMLAVDTIYLLFLGIYLDQVIPSDFGVAKPWNFCCLPRYWRGSTRRRRGRGEGEEASLLEADAELAPSDRPENFEAIAENLRRQESED